MSELMMAQTESDLMRMKIEFILARRDISQNAITNFQELTFQDGRSPRMSINSGQRTFSQFMKLLDGADKFRQCVHGLHPDKKLAAEYLRAISAVDWLERLPPKALRFALLTGAGMLADALLPTGLGVPTGISIGAADTFLLDKLIRGWKPSQFIGGPVRKFTAGE